MPNPNFLTANQSGIELMPGINDQAQGYDVNRIIQALNGTNIVPITTGDLTVVGALSVSGSSSMSGRLTLRGDYSVVGDNLVVASQTSSTKGGWIGFVDNVTTKWEMGKGSTNTFILFDNVRNADVIDILSNGDMTLMPSAGNVVIGGSGSLSVTHDLYILAASAKIIPGSTQLSLRNNANNADNVLILDNGSVTIGNNLTLSAGLFFTTASSKVVPGSTKLSFRNNADSADTLSLPDNGQAVIRNGLALLGGTIDVGAGTLGYAEKTTTQGTFTALTDITGLSVTVTVGAGRRIRVSAECSGSGSVAGDFIGFYIRESSTTLQTYRSWIPTSANTHVFARWEVILTPSGGSHTYKVSMARDGGSGNITMQGAAAEVAYILVEDIGT